MNTQRARNDLYGCRVLLCEDEGILCMQLRKAVMRAGCHVVGEAQEGEEAIRLAQQLQPDLILMDHTLLGPMDGVTAACTILRQRRVPILMLTARNDPELMDAAQKAGVAGFFIKPLRGDEIVKAIQTVLDRFHGPGGMALPFTD